LFVRIEGVKDLIHVKRKIGHIKSIERNYFYKWATNKNQFCKKIKECIIVHAELSLGINHPD
jgi:hypothetical protein